MNESSLVGLCVQDYKSLCAAVTICATVVNTQTDTETDRQTDRSAYMRSSASWAETM